MSAGQVQFTSQITVELVQSSGDDRSVMAAARVSTKGSESLHDWSSEATEGLINYLMKNRHGTPFEHNMFTFYIKAPIFVFREFHRHRIGWSYNEESGRYKQLDPLFYLPPGNRAFMQVEGSKPGHYEYLQGTSYQLSQVHVSLHAADIQAYEMYEGMLEQGVAKEVARMCLPVNIFSSMYATCNARSLMAFLSLRQKHSKREPVIVTNAMNSADLEWHGEAMFPSNPMWEINFVADEMERIFQAHMPITARAFRKNGYVGP